VKNLIVTIACLITLVLPNITSAAQADSLQVYAFAANTTTLADQDNYYQFNWARAGVRAYKDQFMVRMEYDYANQAMKYSYLEYATSWQGWKLGTQFGRHLLPAMYNFYGPSVQPTPRLCYAFSDLDIYGVGLYGYAKRGPLTIQLSNYGFENYSANLSVGPLSTWWTKHQGQGLSFKKSFNPWVNLYAGWTNYEDRPGRKFPERRNAAFVENHVRLGQRARIYLLQDFGDFRGATVGGVSYLLYPGDVENTIGIFYDSQELWQVRLTFNFSQMLRS